MSMPALRLLKKERPEVRIVYYTPHAGAVQGLPFLDEVRPVEDYPLPSAVWSLATPRVVLHLRVVSGYRHGYVELLYEASIPPQRHIARIYGDQLGLDVRDIRPSCVFDLNVIQEYKDAWTRLPRPWVLINRKTNNSPNKDWMDENWDHLITELLKRYTVIEIGAGPDHGVRPQHPHYVDQIGRLSLDRFLAVIAAADLHVGPVSGPLHIAAAAGKRSVVIYGGYEHPDCSSYPGDINLYTDLTCSPCWLLTEPCPIDRVCLRRISTRHVEEAIQSLIRAGLPDTHGQVAVPVLSDAQASVSSHDTGSLTYEP